MHPEVYEDTVRRTNTFGLCLLSSFQRANDLSGWLARIRKVACGTASSQWSSPGSQQGPEPTFYFSLRFGMPLRLPGGRNLTAIVSDCQGLRRRFFEIVTDFVLLAAAWHFTSVRHGRAGHRPGSSRKRSNQAVPRRRRATGQTGGLGGGSGIVMPLGGAVKRLSGGFSRGSPGRLRQTDWSVQSNLVRQRRSPLPLCRTTLTLGQRVGHAANAGRTRLARDTARPEIHQSRRKESGSGQVRSGVVDVKERIFARDVGLWRRRTACHSGQAQSEAKMSD